MDFADLNEGFSVPAKGLSREELEGVLGVMTEQLWPSEKRPPQDPSPSREVKIGRERNSGAVSAALSEEELESILKGVMADLWQGGN